MERTLSVVLHIIHTIHPLNTSRLMTSDVLAEAAEGTGPLQAISSLTTLPGLPFRYVKLGSLERGEAVFTAQVDRHSAYSALLNQPVPEGKLVEVPAATWSRNPLDRIRWCLGLGIPLLVTASVKLDPDAQGTDALKPMLARKHFTSMELALLASAGASVSIEAAHTFSSVWAPARLPEPSYGPLSFAWGLALENVFGIRSAAQTRSKQPSIYGTWLGNRLLCDAAREAAALSRAGMRVIGYGYGKIHIAAPSGALPVMSDRPSAGPYRWRFTHEQHTDSLLGQKIAAKEFPILQTADEMVKKELL